MTEPEIFVKGDSLFHSADCTGRPVADVVDGICNIDGVNVTATRLAASWNLCKDIPLGQMLGRQLSDYVAEEAYLGAMQPVGDGLGVHLSGLACQMLAESFAGQFVGSGAINFLEAHMVHPEIGEFNVTIQRKEGKTPGELKAEVEVERDRLAAALQQIVALGAEANSVAIAGAALSANSAQGVCRWCGHSGEGLSPGFCTACSRFQLPVTTYTPTKGASMPSFQDFTDQLAEIGVKIVDEPALKSATSQGVDWVATVVRIAAQGRKAGCWFKRPAKDIPSDAKMHVLLSGYGFTEQQQRIFIQNMQCAGDEVESDPYAAGFDAGQQGSDVGQMPYPERSERGEDWLSGFKAGKARMETAAK